MTHFATLTPENYFDGGANLTKDTDAGLELAQKIRALETAANTNETTASAAIPKSIVTQQGDLITSSGAGVPVVLAHGTAGQFLQTGGHAANPSWATPPNAIAGGAAGYMTGADKTKLDGIEAAADVTDSGNVAAAGAMMVSDIYAVDAVIAVANAGGGATDAALTLQLNDLDGAAITAAKVVMIIAAAANYAGMAAVSTHPTFATATAGSILGSGSGWACVKTSAAGAFACTVTNASDETLYFTACTPNGGADAVANAAIVRGCIPDAATWS